ncbi:hypothetical protein Vretimale_18783 [Volvox reticuliferus]|uniref:G-patch domain-containing protein n=2 Tax=Volvox reticuliferus TaxID=1737510 RepID=A0A8J4LZP2_9CHLO|nr:hypothetical protein Vretifemale_19089 [Volvox reticuliferus]GIM16128.1 hypothetical protein Vretimale_18783 [Volvox reticuliferus]
MKLPPGYVAGVGVQKATAYGGLGQKLMERMGWSKGQGLGKEKHGMKEAIEVKKKEDTLGVGANATSWNWENKYWEDAYNSAIKSINHETSSSSSSSSGSGRTDIGGDGTSSSGSSDSDSDSDSGGATRRRGKRARKGSTTAQATVATVNRDGTVASASAAELRIAAELAKDPWGRWGGRAGKMARIRAQEQEEADRARAKLGLPPVSTTAAPAGSESADSSSSSSSDEDNDGNRPSTSGRNAATVGGDKSREKSKRKVKATAEEMENGEKKKKKEKHGRVRTEGKKDNKAGGGSAAANGIGASDSAAPRKAAPKRVVMVIGNDAAIAARLRMFASFQPTPATGWWGAKMFVSAGMLESLEDEAACDQRLADAAQRLAEDQAAGRVALAGTAAVAAGQRRGFNEDDQTALYMRAHDFQRMGRRGLGKAELKVGGAKWEGTKKTFDDEEEEEEEEEEGNEGEEELQRSGGEGEPKAEAAVYYEGKVGGDEEQQTKKTKKKKKKDKEKADRDPAAHEDLRPTEKPEKKAKKERGRQQEQERQHQVELEATAAVDGAVKKSKRRRCADGTAVMAAGKAEERQGMQQQDNAAANRKPAILVSVVEPASAVAVAGDGASNGVAVAAKAAAPKPKWLKLARMVLKKSVERRVKLQKVVAELVQHAEEQHRQHRHHHKHNLDPRESGKKSGKAKVVEAEAGTAGSRDQNGSPWDHDSVREALERKVRKSNSGLAIDGKFLTMVGAS